MSKAAKLGFLMLILFTIISCASDKITYLNRHTDTASQDDVAKELGPPHYERTLQDGNIVWSYQYTKILPVSGGGSISKCREYILFFDENKVLRKWREQKCQ